MKKSIIKALAFATLALSLVFTVVSASEVTNEGITTFRRSDLPPDHDIIN